MDIKREPQKNRKKYILIGAGVLGWWPSPLR